MERVRQHGTIEYSDVTGEELYLAIRGIVDRCQYAKVNGHMVDLFSASVIKNVSDALTLENRKKLLSMPIEKIARVSFKLIEKAGEK